MSSIIGGYNNITTGTCAIGTHGSIGICGSIGLTGSVGMTGTQGIQGHTSITDWKDDMMKKYPRFIIKTEYDVMTFAPNNIITDTRTNKEYKFTPKSISNIANETDNYIQQLITTIRDEKLNNIING